MIIARTPAIQGAFDRRDRPRSAAGRVILVASARVSSTAASALSSAANTTAESCAFERTSSISVGSDLFSVVAAPAVVPCARPVSIWKRSERSASRSDASSRTASAPVHRANPKSTIFALPFGVTTTVWAVTPPCDISAAWASANPSAT